MVDVTFSFDEESNTAIFLANTLRAEEVMGGPEVSVPMGSAHDYKQHLIDSGLKVDAFP
jgi:hypothetical protein